MLRGASEPVMLVPSRVVENGEVALGTTVGALETIRGSCCAPLWKAQPNSVKVRCILCPVGKSVLVTVPRWSNIIGLLDFAAAALLSGSALPQPTAGEARPAGAPESCEFFLRVPGVKEMIRLSRELSEDALWRLLAAVPEVRVYVVVRRRGGKGGFGKNLARKGRLYIKAQRRGETNADLRLLARNLRGERLGGVAPGADGQGNVTAAAEQQPQQAAGTRVGNNSSQRTSVKEWQVNDAVEQAKRVTERLEFGALMKEAVRDGFTAALQRWETQPVSSALSPSK